MSDTKNYLIIGGNSGIGKSLANRLIAKNNTVILASRTGTSAPGIKSILYDSLHDQIKPESLPAHLDGLVYCPGSINLKPFHRISDQEFLDDFNINVLGAIRTIRSVLPLLKKSEKASIVLFSTIAVQQGMPFHASVATAKGALEGLTRSLAAELAPKIRVNAIAPSLTNTPLAGKLLASDDKKKASDERHPLKRIGEADDIAALASFLLSSDSSWITGQILHADGGLSALRV
jgi:NAD(P)-dependent dehydrogenase (short-subunit alcohol dehydrogenase family)